MVYTHLAENGPVEIEKGDALALAFKNDSVENLSWQGLTVKVADRVTGQDKHILSEICGHVQAGKSRYKLRSAAQA